MLVPLIVRFAIVATGAALIGLVSVRAGWLTRRGAAAAVAIGACAAVAGVGFVALLLAFFVPSSFISRRSSAAGVASTGPRGARQVIANGAVFAVAAVGFIFAGGERWLAVAAGAMAAATSDTWSTEIGMRFGGTPRHLMRMVPVPPGTSGAVTVVGMLAALAGATFIAWVTALVSSRIAPWSVFVGGMAGSIVDSCIGATLQERRWCAHCQSNTEQLQHYCGQSTLAAGGVRFLRNDEANLLATLTGGVVACLATQ